MLSLTDTQSENLMVQTSANMNVSITTDGTKYCNEIPIEASSQEMDPREEEPTDFSSTCVFVCSLIYIQHGAMVPYIQYLLTRDELDFPDFSHDS